MLLSDINIYDFYSLFRFTTYKGINLSMDGSCYIYAYCLSFKRLCILFPQNIFVSHNFEKKSNYFPQLNSRLTFVTIKKKVFSLN
jgi:hypothetical protein